MIDIKINQQKLLDIIKDLSVGCVESKQVYTRLYDLIEIKLSSTVEKLTNSYPDRSRSQVLRQAYLHSDYIELLEKYLSSRESYTLSKVMYDTHMMLFEARRSINSYNKELINHGKSLK